MTIRVLALAAALASAALTSAPLVSAPWAAAAQAVCSAPHSAPVVTPSGSIATLAPGQGWVQGSVRGVRSVQFYGTGGSRHAFPGDAEATTVSTFLTGAVGVLPGIEVWAQLPVHRLRLAEDAQTRERTALGDARMSLRIGSGLFGLSGVPVSVRGGVKLPGSDFPVDPRVLPLTEGQTDYEVAVESGASAGSGRWYGVAWAGYRWRTLNESTGREPGDEWFGHVALGGSLGAARLELGLEVMDGRAPVQDRLAIPASARRLVEFNPTVAWAAGSGQVELGVQVPLSGRNVPRGPGLSVGYLLTWGGR